MHIDLSQVEKKIVVAENISSGIIDGSGSYLTIYNPNPVVTNFDADEAKQSDNVSKD